MQIINHKNTNLTISQRFFIEKSLELLYLGTIDSYRVKLNNSKTILEELRYCLIEFNKGRIKHFHTIKTKKTIENSLLNETIELIQNDVDIIKFNTFSKKYFLNILNDLDENNSKKAITCINILLTENRDYIQNIMYSLKILITNNDNTFEGLSKIDRVLNYLFSELIFLGYAKGFLYKFVYGVFVNSLTANKQFDTHFENFSTRIHTGTIDYKVIFRIDTSHKVYEAISEFTPTSNCTLKDTIDDITITSKGNREMPNFNMPATSRKFLLFTVLAPDYLSALKKAKAELSEYLDVINLGLSDEMIDIHNRVLVIDERSPQSGNFQQNINFLDGKYKVEKEHYLYFRQKIPTILSDANIQPETKEKIKSAVRYLRLGNQSTEVEHKFINYWIGLEYLFSNYESQNTITRLKSYFIDAHSLAYTKRNIYSFLKSFSHLSTAEQTRVQSYTTDNKDFLKSENFYSEIIDNLLSDYPLLAYRAMSLKKSLFKNPNKPKADDYLKKHIQNSEIHFTRIYRLRNEIIHDAVTNTNNELITSNLRYYLTFMLNELITFFSNTFDEKISIEDFFILNELKLGNLKQNGFLLSDLLDIECSIDFIS